MRYAKPGKGTLSKGSNSWTQKYKQTRRNLILGLAYLYHTYYFTWTVVHYLL